MEAHSCRLVVAPDRAGWKQPPPYGTAGGGEVLGEWHKGERAPSVGRGEGWLGGGGAGRNGYSAGKATPVSKWHLPRDQKNETGRMQPEKYSIINNHPRFCFSVLFICFIILTSTRAQVFSCCRVA